jgi:hypothetical protein
LLVVGTACGGGTNGNGGEAASERDPRRDIQPAAQKRAESIVLELSDFPEGWRASSSDDEDPRGEEEFQRCIGVDFSSLTLIGDAESTEFTHEDSFDASSVGLVFESEGQAEEAIREFSEGIESDAVDQCARKGIETDTNDLTAGRIEWGQIAVRELSLTPPEVEEARAWQMALPFKETDREGAEVSSTFHLDIVHLREGDTVATMRTFDNALNDFDPELRDKLLQVLADRMARAKGRR